MHSLIQKFRLFFIAVLLINSINFSQEIKKEVEHVEWSYDKVIYEVNVRQYTPEGTFKAFEKHIPRLKEMGVGIIWLMPIHPIGQKNRKGSLGSYYSVKDYFAVNPEFGSLSDFKSLVKKIHEAEMYVIIDWVANHTSWDNTLTTEHPEWYMKDLSGNFIPPVKDWSDVIDLNFDNKDLWNYMIGALKYWVEECDIDGYRCDVAGMVPIDFWEAAIKELNEIKPVFMLAEAWEPQMHKVFDMTYNWDMHHTINDVAQGEKTVDDIRKQLGKEADVYPESAFRMQFTSNHDENSNKGTEFERLEEAAEVFAVFTNLIPGMPLIYNGQEAGLNKRLQFFEKDTIDWKEHRFKNIYTRLFKLKTENEALFNGERGGKLNELESSERANIFAFIREKNDDKILAIFNLSDKAIAFEIKDVSLNGSYIDIFTDEEMTFHNTENINLDAWGYKVLVNK
jgi:glycosidase